MSVELNHTIVAARDRQASATFVSEVLGLDAPTRFGPFAVVALANGVNLDFADADGEITHSTTRSWAARPTSTPSSRASKPEG